MDVFSEFIVREVFHQP